MTFIKNTDHLTIIAFSQGTVIFEIMMSHKLFNRESDKVILLSPFGIMDCSLCSTNLRNINIPCLIIFGQKEGIFNITLEHYEKYRSMKLNNSTIVVYDHGRSVPFKPKDKQIIKEFLKR
jgi:hypothetical protein